MKNSYYSNGKLLITGEYMVLKGAKAFALPVNKGQKTSIESGTEPGEIHWNSFEKDNCWFEAIFSLKDFETLHSNDLSRAAYIQKLLMVLKKVNPGYLKEWDSLIINNYLDFNPDWGLGSSSTLISNMASFAGVDPFLVNTNMTGGSGFDIACANSNKATLYQTFNNERKIEKVNFNPGFAENLYFIWLGNKKSTAQSINWFDKSISVANADVDKISEISESIYKVSKLDDFKELLGTHNQIMEKVLGVTAVQNQYFSDFDGVIKPLGAWGGDFVLAATSAEKIYVLNYFKNKGLDIILGYKDLFIKNEK